MQVETIEGQGFYVFFMLFLCCFYAVFMHCIKPAKRWERIEKWQFLGV